MVTKTQELRRTLRKLGNKNTGITTNFTSTGTRFLASHSTSHLKGSINMCTVMAAIRKIFHISRTSRRKVRRNSCVFVTKFNPSAPDIRKIFRKHRSVLDSDEQAKKILPESAILVSYKRNANLKELLAPSNPYKPNKLEGEGCYKCDAKRCDSCKNFLIFGNSFRAAATGRIFLIFDVHFQ